jgi:hypothetical protein
MCHDTIVFLINFTTRLHAASPRIGVSVEIPGGASMCSDASTRLMASSPFDRIITMGTYSWCGSPTVARFNDFVVSGMAGFGQRFGVGMDAVDAPVLPAQSYAKEFSIAAAAGVPEIAIWFYTGPTGNTIAEPWWSMMAAFKSGQSDFQTLIAEHEHMRRILSASSNSAVQ